VESFFISAGVVLAAEIGDKTQLLALMLAARYRAPMAVISGIFCATVLNHLAAAWFGSIVAGWLSPDVLRWALAISFLVMAAWTLVPDTAEDAPKLTANAGAFLATLIAFFLVEMGDKTQIATIVLSARFDDLIAVTAGTTAGMMIADVPAVFMGNFFSNRLPLKLIRIIAAGIFAILGIAVLADIAIGLF
jgi:putative Ca2+/H+ antiporter (TMEM165/GDT1 family)